MCINVGTQEDTYFGMGCPPFALCPRIKNYLNLLPTNTCYLRKSVPEEQHHLIEFLYLHLWMID